jgi:hypothetical protein
MTMATIPQTFSADHTLTVDAALRDARTQLPRTADAKRADRGLVLALNGHVTLYSPTEAHVTSETDPEVVYHVHARGGCDCYDAMRRLEQMPDAAPGARACKHWYAVVLTAMAHLNLQVKGYVPAVPEVWYPAVYQGESGCTWSGRATETLDSGWFFAFGDGGTEGLYVSERDLELWDRRPEHVIQWYGEVTRYERWLAGR